MLCLPQNMRPISKLCLIVKRQPTAQMAHLVFAVTQPNAEKPKEPFFANAPLKMMFHIQYIRLILTITL